MQDELNELGAARKELAKLVKIADAIQNADGVLEKALLAASEVHNLEVRLEQTQADLDQLEWVEAEATKNWEDTIGGYSATYGRLLERIDESRAALAAEEEAAEKRMSELENEYRVRESVLKREIKNLEDERDNTKRALESDRDEWRAFRRKMGVS